MKGIQDTSSLTYRQLMGNGLRYEVPRFQRDYTWETEQWDDLWYDINALRKKEEADHYMGYLVLQTPDNKGFQIIDGQQRLTTISIIILAVLKCLDSLGNAGTDTENNKKRLDALRSSYIGYIDPVTLISSNKLKLNRNSDDFYRQQLVLLRDLPSRNINSSERQMKDCFNWFYEKIRKEFTTGESLAHFIDDLADKLFFTRITVSDDFNAFRVFETLNARGVQLSAADLLKNYFFSVVDESKPHKSEIDELELLWSKTVEKLGNKKFEDYLRYFWNSRNKTIRKPALFKAIRKNIIDKTQVFDIVRELNDVADVYVALQNPEDELWSGKNEIKESLQTLQLFQIKQTLSLFISGYYNLSEQSFSKLVQTCATISFRYNVIGGLNPNEQEDIYNSIANLISKTKHFDISAFKPVYVSNDNFETAFSNKVFKNTQRNHKIVKYILAKIEAYRFRNGITTSGDSYTVEHILPENADDSWGNFDNEAINRSVFRLGNLTLLERVLNKDAGILKFSEKKDFYAKSNSKITQQVAENFDNWEESSISSRQRELAKDAKSIWQVQF
ncbi:MAG TPA: DUF262 domain-containing HNH endonuclease family protein [Chitinophagaceae bacterium]|jgi:uncharacterized protein with ParB-like and HNH nuclease domain|nr:DUF262 domain-containing HNH endonuclease family protein [Chitinophagaceae bacterium]HMU59330.1 DUF262 domain-containing HNH endonuclease family protein [Chitinophagaceae bacterium]